MEKTVYIYGSARDAATRALRRAAVPRQMQVRLGPWIIRPSRRTPVELAQLVKYEADCLAKMSQGLIQVQSGDGAVFTEEQVTAMFAAVKGGPTAPDYMKVPFAELYELMRSDTPTQVVWDAFVERAFADRDEDREFLPSLRTRVRSLTEYAERLRDKIDVTKALSIIAAAEEKARLEEAVARDTAAKEKAEQERKEAAARTTEPAPAEVGDLPPNVDLEQMEFEAPTTATSESTEPAPTPDAVEIKAEPSATPEAPAAEATEEPVTEAPTSEEAPVPADEPTNTAATPEQQKAAKEAQLPEGWRTLTNTKLVELLTGLNIEMPERQNKASLVAAVEKWLEGS